MSNNREESNKPFDRPSSPKDREAKTSRINILAKIKDPVRGMLHLIFIVSSVAITLAVNSKPLKCNTLKVPPST